MEGFNLLGGINKYIRKNDKILLKPNLLAPKKPETGALTHPEFIRAVIHIVKKAGAHPAVGDSPGLGTAEQIVKSSGIKKICEEENVPVINLQTPVKKTIKNGKIAKTITIAEEIYKFDKIINLPKLKNHGLTQITVALKNLYGVIPGLRKGAYHFRYKSINEFNSLLIELNQLVKPVINIVDGILGMEGDGPASGDPKKADLIIMGEDTISVDYISAILMNYDPDSISFIKTAKEYKFGGYTKELINVKGKKIEDCIIKNFKTIKGKMNPEIFPPLLRILIQKFLIKKPVVKKSKCTGCKKCIEICPPKTIKLIHNKAHIFYKNCIKCYCCSEICPIKAIDLKISPFKQN